MTALAKGFQPRMAFGFEGEIQFEIWIPTASRTATTSDWWTTQIKVARAFARRRTAEAPAVTIHVNVADFVRIVGGLINPVGLWVDKRLDVEGDVTQVSAWSSSSAVKRRSRSRLSTAAPSAGEEETSQVMSEENVEIVRKVRERSEALAGFEDLIEGLIGAGESVISIGSVRARGRASGIEVELPNEWGVWTVRDGRIARIVFFDTRTEALEAAGLSE